MSHAAESLGHPTLTDVAGILRVCEIGDGLAPQSTRFCSQWCRDFAATSVVARSSTTLVGAVLAHQRPQAPHTLFVWQVAVAHTVADTHLSNRMIEFIVGDGFRYVECLVMTQGRTAGYLAAFAGHLGLATTRDPLFSARPLSGGVHAEHILRVGPIGRSQ